MVDFLLSQPKPKSLHPSEDRVRAIAADAFQVRDSSSDEEIPPEMDVSEEEWKGLGDD